MERNIIWICLLAIVILLSIEGLLASKLLTKDDDIPEAQRREKEAANFSCTVANKGKGIRLVWSMLAKDNTTAAKPLSMDSTITRRKNPIVEGNLKKFEIITTQDLAKNYTTYTLVIRGISRDDNGTYQCMLMIRNVEHHEYPRARGRLVVLVPPVVTPTVPLITVEEGGTVTLDCNIEGSPWPQVIWSRDTFRPLSSGAMMSQPKRPAVYKGNPYTIEGVVKADAGGYNCSAQNGVKPNSQARVLVKVLFPPEIKAIISKVGQVAGKSKWVELRCSVASYPAAVLSWHSKTTSGTQEVKETLGKYEVTTASIEALYGEKELHFILKILNVTDSDFGNYTCKAVNRFGNGDDEITVFETKTCQGPSCENYKPPPKKKDCNSNAELCIHIKDSSSIIRSSLLLTVIAAVLAIVQTNVNFGNSS